MARAAKGERGGRGRRRRGEEGATPRRRIRPIRWLFGWIFRLALLAVVLLFAALGAYAVIDPPTTPYMLQERQRLGALQHEWVDMEEIAPVMARAAVAAEDANFCLHWGLDLDAIRIALEAGATRGASTISQQTVKNVYLWQGRSWLRKSLEAGITPLMEVIWSKERILEVYLNMIEFGPGIFGVGAAAEHYFGKPAANLTAGEAARLAAVLPSPQTRDAANLTTMMLRRAASIQDGAATIAGDGRAACF
ncbi:monofunctional biosynthetic peptidoglycan transglycosylase [Pseudoroseicyclus tamaricis]|uniref:Biosynthetic peptidoglycan transglycosylase n=2 Tax=Pseudoroseicyclus tamaricis TaxID=2705421 RepID=A0A6B2JWM4_9RHOB|nr:monofunctional biosynthetic peptidoglycan transglycosylase [Pseudoroseicyclus tamaricis]NDV02907.1 monofunctional biosynthetic peptidoglycan transglycosylase [Pseudoroseicyclus tamaricis]